MLDWNIQIHITKLECQGIKIVKPLIELIWKNSQKFLIK